MKASGAATKHDTLDVTFVRDKWIHLLILQNELIDKRPGFFEAAGRVWRVSEPCPDFACEHFSSSPGQHRRWHLNSFALNGILSWCTLSTELGPSFFFPIDSDRICALATNWCYFVMGGKQSGECETLACESVKWVNGLSPKNVTLLLRLWASEDQKDIRIQN